MNFSVFDPRSAAGVFRALIRLPVEVRRTALERVRFIGVGRGASGVALSRAALGDAEWVVVLLERDPEDVLNTAAHEMAHVECGHTVASAFSEREAAELARAWGFDGAGADAERCEAGCRQIDERDVVRARSKVTTDSLWIECSRCALSMHVLAPVVPGSTATVALVCPGCEQFQLLEGGDLTPCDCGKRATVTWTESATPETPVARWSCDCGLVVTRKLFRPLSKSELFIASKKVRDASSSAP